MNLDFAITSKGKTVYAKVSYEDFPYLMNFRWCDNGNGYICRNAKIQGKTQKIYIHRLIALRMGLDPNKQIDHINGDKFDNRRVNLRIANKSLNGANRGMPINNTSGSKGIRQIKGSHLWTARLGWQGKNLYLGVFDNKEDADKCYRDTAKKLFGEYSYENF